MDPITAFQVAGTVITFVEFSRNLLNDAREVYQSPSGATSRVVKLSRIADDLKKAREHMTASLNSSPSASHAKSDETLLKICERCAGMETELQQALEGLQARGETKFDFAKSSVAVAFNSMWSQGKINNLERRLREAQSEITMAVVISLWEQERVHGKLREESLNAILANVNESDRKLDKLMQELLQPSVDRSSRNASQRSMLFQELWRIGWRPDQDLTGRIENVSSTEFAHFIEQDIINSLWFKAIESRHKAIPETYGSTYEWIYDPNGPTGFTGWLKQNQNLLYWITGKAGSGKSTLMKYLVHHASTIRYLQKGAGGLPLLFCHFYFWEAATEELQHSREGLVRTILWQCLKLHPYLIQKVVPRRWAAYNALRGWEGPVPDWTFEELQETFHGLASMNNSSIQLVLFIDGLDEFDGDPATLIQWIKDTVTKFSVKLCVGSRPWTAFSDAFDQYPSLTMQTLNAVDIQIYIDGQLNASRAFRDWQALSPEEAEGLRQSLFVKAEGVFLWVFIVFKELTPALQRGRSLHELRAIVDSLPTDIMKLYTKIYETVSSEGAKKAAVYFSLLSTAIHKVNTYELWFIEDNAIVSPNDRPARISMQSIVRRRLDSSTRGMVEVSTDDYIVFHHRSVKEWLSLPEVVPLISTYLPEDFDAGILLMKGCRSTAVQTFPAIKNEDQFLPFFWRKLNLILWYASQVSESPVITPKLCQELELSRDTFTRISEAQENRGGDPLYLVGLLAKIHSSMPQRLKTTLPPHPRNPGKHQSSAAETIKVDEYAIDHWYFTLGKYRASSQSCFTVLAAQITVYPYVMSQVTKYPDLLDEKDDRISLLHGAIFGPNIYQRDFTVARVEYRKRLRLVEALLDSGASVKGRIHIPSMPFGDRDVYYLDAIDCFNRTIRQAIGPDEYWDEVKQLLREKTPKGTRARRLLRAVLGQDTVV